MTPTTPWSIRAWPPILWQAGRESQLRLHHLSTRVTLPGDRMSRTAGQTIWGGQSDDGEAGVAWDWVQICGDVVAMADPMSVVTNLRLIGEEGEVLTALESARLPQRNRAYPALADRGAARVARRPRLTPFCR